MNAMPVPLRRRVALAMTVLGFLLSGLFAAATLVVSEDYEHVLATEILRGQAEDYGLRLSNGLPAQLPRTHRLSGYVQAEAPAPYARFPPGVHESVADDGVHVGVFDTSAGRLYFTIDLSDIEALEAYLHWVLASIVVFGTLLAGLVGWYFAGAALRPLGRLARAVDDLPVAPRTTALRTGVSDDELGRLAGAIDDYQRRLVEADAHEQAFFADASHELRTPIAIVHGVTEVMLDDVGPDTDPRRLERLRRLDRGVREMTGLVEMLLAVSRRRVPTPEWREAADVLHEAVASLQADSAGSPVEIVASGRWEVPSREAQLLLRHVIGKLGWPSSGDSLLLRLEGNGLDLLPCTPAGRAAPAVRSDTGGVGALAQRLASQLGWRLAQTSRGGIRIELPADTIAEAGHAGGGSGSRAQNKSPGTT